jgi:hypothetical protein
MGLLEVLMCLRDKRIELKCERKYNHAPVAGVGAGTITCDGGLQVRFLVPSLLGRKVLL